MSLKLSTSGNNKPFENAPEGVHPAICIAILDLGTQTSKYGAQRQVRIMHELPFSLMADGKPHITLRNYNATLGKGSDLRRDLESWRGKAFSEKEAEEFDLYNLLGKQCQINYTPGKDGDGMFVTGIMPIPRRPDGKPMIDMPSETHNALKFLELSFDRFDDKVFDSLSDKTRQKIADSPEFKRLFPRGLWAKGQSAPAPQPDNVASTPEPTAQQIDDDSFPPF